MQARPEDVRLVLDGVEWAGWKSCQIVRSVDAMAGAFAFGVTDRWQEGALPLPFAPGMACSVTAGGEPMIKGYVDRVDHSLTQGDHSTGIYGRDASADLVDCSAVHEPGSWKNRPLSALCAELAAPFGVPVNLEADEGAVFPAFSIQPGEKVAEAMQRLLKQRELLAMPDGRGGLRLAKLGQSVRSTVLEQGRNLLEAQASFDAESIFSRYVCTGQKQGTDSAFGKACSVRGVVEDTQVGRYRPLVIRSSQQGEAGYMRRRAQWEKTSRRSKALTVNVTVQGWRDEDGMLWTPGDLVPVRLPLFFIEAELLIAGVTYSKGVQGTTAQLELREAASFMQEPAKPSGASSGDGGNPWAVWAKQAREAKASGQKVKEFV